MNNQEVPQGYKETKVGVIPLEWEVVKIGEIGDLVGGGTPSTTNKDYWQGSIPWISSSDLTDKSIYTVNKHRFITNEAISKSATKKIPKNSILIISRVGVGKVAINNEELCVSQDFQCLIPKESNTIFLTYLIKEKTKILLAYNQGTSIKGFVKSDLKNLKIPLPPLKEQQKIAKILTTWDDAISKQEELIKIKEQLKKGLMQKLLSGEVRFDGFSGEWENIYLGEITTITTGSSNREDSTEYDGEFTFFDRSEDIRTSNRYLFEGEAIIVAGEGQQFIPKYFVGKFDLHQRTYAIMNFKNSVGKYLFYYIWQYNNYFLAQAVGSTVKSLRLPMFKKMKIKLPSLQEQEKIAKVLSNSDKEIELLKNELESLKEQKKGLMQRLLSGEVRVEV